jgi:hypothetical protein
MAATKQAVLSGMGRCHDCGQELIEIDNRGERLTGCGAPTDGDRWIRLSVEELPHGGHKYS